MRTIPKKRKLRELQKHISVITRNATTMLHLVNIDSLIALVRIGIKLCGLEKRLLKNARDIQVVRKNVHFKNLPDCFDGYRILFMSDLHIDVIKDLHNLIAGIAAKEDYDLCLLGGDYRLHTRGNTSLSTLYLSELIPKLKKKTRVIGILGNHDEYSIGEELHSQGVDVLVNENICIENNGKEIYICGIDDANYYAADNLDEATQNIPDNAFTILLSHSPDLYKKSETYGFALFLAGHTHGGQLCLPGGVAVFSECNAPRKMIHGEWSYKSMHGYTSSGVGCSGIPARMNCPPEIVIFTLKQQ